MNHNLQNTVPTFITTYSLMEGRFRRITIRIIHHISVLPELRHVATSLLAVGHSLFNNGIYNRNLCNHSYLTQCIVSAINR